MVMAAHFKVLPFQTEVVLVCEPPFIAFRCIKMEVYYHIIVNDLFSPLLHCKTLHIQFYVTKSFLWYNS